MPAPVLTATGLNDLVATTLRNLGRPNFTELATDIQQFTAMSNLLNRNRVTFSGGTGIQWDVMVNHAQSAENVGLYASDNVNVVDTMVQATADWRNTTASWAIDGHEVSMNAGGETRIVDLVKERRLACMIALAEKMETNFWGPPVSSTDQVTPWGVNMWITKNATEGFNGGAPTGYTAIGLNPTTYPRWQNWTAQYTAVTRDDFIRKARKMATFTRFKPPVEGIPTFHTGDQFAAYTNYGVIGPLEEALESQNDNLGNDVASKDGQVMFRRTTVTWVPILERDTTNPFYFINWGSFKTFILNGWWMKETNVPIYPGQHTVSAHFLDSTYNFVAKNRRVHGVLATGTSYPS